MSRFEAGMNEWPEFVAAMLILLAWFGDYISADTTLGQAAIVISLLVLFGDVAYEVLPASDTK